MAGGHKAPLAIVAGGGALPFEIARSVTSQGRPAVLIGLADEASPELESWDIHYRLKWGEIGRLFEILKTHQCQDVVFIGSVTRRPDFKSIRLDFGAVKLLPRILHILIGGDDQVLRSILTIFEERGHHIASVPDIAPELVVASGPLGTRKPSDTHRADLKCGLEAIQALGPFDMGQAAVCVRGRLIAIEGAEGTDAMTRRAGDLRKSGRVNWPDGEGVLIKASKPGQDVRVDLPTIGPETVKAAQLAGLAGIAIEAGRVLIAQKAETLRRAVEAKLFIHGFEQVEEHDD